MKLIVLTAVAVCAAAVLFITMPGGEQDMALAQDRSVVSTPASQTGKAGVLVELFTSEGCSSCPPADRALIALSKEQPVKDAEVIALSLHVDYWNRLGWTDPFSSSQFSERQGFYSSTFKLGGQVYTPQMVVDGAAQFVGSNMAEARKAIENAAKMPKAELALEVTENKLGVRLTNIPEHKASNVFLAIAEDDLSSNVRRGENGGRTLPHAAVVRELSNIGRLDPGKRTFETKVGFDIKDGWKRSNTKLVVFAQEESTSRIIGVSQLRLASL